MFKRLLKWWSTRSTTFAAEVPADSSDKSRPGAKKTKKTGANPRGLRVVRGGRQ